MSGDEIYALLPNAIIDPQYGRAVKMAAVFAAMNLGLPPVAIGWLYEPDGVTDLPRVAAPGMRTSAFTVPEDAGRIFIHPEWNPALETVLHECRHLWQFREWGITVATFAANEARMEADATNWAAEALAASGFVELDPRMPRLRTLP